MAYNKYNNTNILKDIKIIKDDIKNNKLMPYYLFFGEETYLINDIKQSIIKHFNNSNNMNISIYNDNNFDEKKIKEKLSQYGLFQEKKIIIFENLNLFDIKLKRINDSIYNKLTENTDNNIIIFIENNVDKRNKLYKFLQENKAIILEINELPENIIIKFIQEKINKENKKFENENLLLYFLTLVGSNIYNIKNEIDKLLLYTNNKSIITNEVIDNITSIQIEEKIFKMIEMINNKNYNMALKLYSDLLYNKVPIELIIYNLKRNYLHILKIKSMKKENKTLSYMVDNLKLQQWQVNNIINFEKKYTENDIINKIETITDIDTKLKTGRLNREIAINYIIGNIN